MWVEISAMEIRKNTPMNVEGRKSLRAIERETRKALREEVADWRDSTKTLEKQMRYLSILKILETEIFYFVNYVRSILFSYLRNSRFNL